MGYYTRYTVDWNTVEPEYLEFDFFTVSNGDTTEGMKWYNYEYDMVHTSKQYPETTFTLYGEGEESGDIWTAWFRDGKHQKVQAKLVIDKPDWV